MQTKIFENKHKDTFTEQRCKSCSDTAWKTLFENVKDFEYEAPGFYSWIKCRSCNLISISPHPSAETLAIAYPPHYHAYIQPESGITRQLIALSRLLCAQQVKQFITSTSPKVLDIGCSTGDQLVTIGKLKNCKLFGIEYREDTAAIASSKGISILGRDIESTQLSGYNFDLVILQHVLEHVYEPISCLSKIESCLKPDGVLIGEVPNFDSWDALVFGRYWGGGHAPRHIHHFTTDTLKMSLKEAGFIDIKISPSLHTGHWALSFQNLIHKPEHGSLTNGRSWYYPFLLLATLPINLLQFMLHKTGVIRFTAKKRTA